MTCSGSEGIARWFYSLSSFVFLLQLFLYVCSSVLLKLVHLPGRFPATQKFVNDPVEHEYDSSEEENEVRESQYSFVFHEEVDSVPGTKNGCVPGGDFLKEEIFEDIQEDNKVDLEGGKHVYKDALPSPESAKEEDSDSSKAAVASPVAVWIDKSSFWSDCNKFGEGKEKVKKEETEEIEEEEEEEEEERVGCGESGTVESTSKSSSEWRSSMKDSGIDDPFSSSSRTSCRRWETYTLFQKYDEEMTFLDKVAAQKLHETESSRLIKDGRRSISERIFINKQNHAAVSRGARNPYNELEAAYVAQICIAWEALNWNFINFKRRRESNAELDAGCPGHVAQQFQQFHVLLQRYIENEPYEHGRRPEVYARVRLLAPKLLLVPEYREDSEEDRKDEKLNSRISSDAFHLVMKDGIRTFMVFLKADKERPCQVLKAFFRINRNAAVDPALLLLMKKVNNKKLMKLRDLHRSGNCIRKKKLEDDEAMEILMAQIDLKVVSRVLRMADLNELQFHWCEEKMSKVRVSHGKLHRDPSSLFFPPH